MDLAFAFAITAATLTLTDFPSDRTIFHAQTAGGMAAIPVAGTGTPGKVIEARAVSLDDQGADTTAWNAVGTVDGAGNYSTTMLAPRSSSWFRTEVRYQDTPAAIVTKTNRFAAGAFVEDWGQSELANCTHDFYDSGITTLDVVPTYRKSIQALKTNTKLRGRQSAATLKVVGVDALPAGMSWNAGAKTVTVSSGFHILRDWSGHDVYFLVESGAAFGLEECRFTSPAGTTKFNVVRWMPGSTRLSVKWNSFIGPGDYCDINPVLQSFNGTIHGGDTMHNEFVGWPSDVDWMHVGAPGQTAQWAWNYIHYTKNLPAGTLPYNAATTYTAGQGCTVGLYYKIATQTTTGNAPPSDWTSNAFWQEATPHLDPVNIVGGNGGNFRMSMFLIECDNNPLLFGVANTLLRISTDDHHGAIGDVLVEHGRCPRATGIQAFPVHIAHDGTTSVGIVTFRYIDVEPHDAGYLVYPNPGVTVRIGDVTKISDGSAVTLTAGTTAFAPGTDTSGQDDVQFVWHNRAPENTGAAGVQVQSVSNASFLRGQFLTAARAIQMSWPGLKFKMGICADPGRGMDDLLSDADANSYWLDDMAVVARGRQSGAVPGLAMASWYASPSGYGTYYGEVIHQLIDGQKIDGTVVTVPGNIVYAPWSASFHVDHLWSQIYDYLLTRWLVFGPHRREIDQDMTSFDQTVALNQQGNHDQTVLKNYGLIRKSLRTVFPSAYAPYVSTFGLDALNYEMGRSDGAGGWTDDIHPSPKLDGSARFLALHCLAALKELGLVSWPVPQFDQCYWAPNGSYMEVWSSAGAVTTTRLARGLAAMPAGYSHRQVVIGFEINGVPATNVTIVNGRVRIAPNSGVFNSATVITFGEGGASGALKYPQDLIDGIWMNYPIVDVGQAYFEGLPVRPVPSVALLTSPL